MLATQPRRQSQPAGRGCVREGAAVKPGPSRKRVSDARLFTGAALLMLAGLGLYVACVRWLAFALLGAAGPDGRWWMLVAGSLASLALSAWLLRQRGGFWQVVLISQALALLHMGIALLLYGLIADDSGLPPGMAWIGAACALAGLGIGGWMRRRRGASRSR